jgi:hypothetical protein
VCILLMTNSALEAAEQISGGKMSGTIGGIKRRDHLRCSWKLEKLVEALSVFMIANLMHGKARTQPFCEQSM